MYHNNGGESQSLDLMAKQFGGRIGLRELDLEKTNFDSAISGRRCP